MFSNTGSKWLVKETVITSHTEKYFGHHTFAEQSVVLKSLRGPILKLQLMRQTTVFIDTTHVLIQFPLLSIQVKHPTSKRMPDSNLSSLKTN